MDEKESLDIILNMVGKTKKNINQNGMSAILWGTVIGICGLVSFLQMQFPNYIPQFNCWILTWFAIGPQIYLTVAHKKKQQVKTHNEDAINTIWNIYFISIMGLLFYFAVIPNQSDKILAANNESLFIKNSITGLIKPFSYQVPSFGSLMLLIYFIPTLFTGLLSKFKPMIFGGIIMVIFFVLSCFIETKYDFLLMALSSIFGWLIPGILLYRSYKKANV